MKVAVLLRGQARYSKIAAQLFKDIVVNKYPDIEFKFWGHTWRTMAIPLSVPDFKNDKDRYASKIFSTSDIVDRITPWNLTGYNVTGDKLLYDLSKEIININHRNSQDVYKWVLQNNDTTLPNNMFILFPGMIPANYSEYLNNSYNILDDIKYVHRLIVRHTFNLGNLLGQMYSAGLSYDMYTVRDDKSWVPDVIWSTRWDGVFECEKLHDVLDYVVNTSICHPNKYVYAKAVSVTNSRAWVDDYNFLMTPSTAEHFLGNMRERLLKMYTSSRIVLSDLLNSDGHLQHLMWTKLATNDIILAQMQIIGNPPTMSGWANFLIRPGIEKLSPDEMTLSRVRYISHHFVYPAGTPDLLTIEEMNEIMNVDYDG